MYARQRGVLLLPEFDGPSHASYGWQFGTDALLGELVNCFGLNWEDESGTLAPEPPTGQLNPVNENVYKVSVILKLLLFFYFYVFLFQILEELLKDYVEAFTPMHSKDPLSLFHLGGDEVNFKCWNKDQKIKDWIRAQGMEYDLIFNNEGYLYLWSVYQEKALRALTTANKDKFQDGLTSEADLQELRDDGTI